MAMRRIPDSELIINPDGSIYHLCLRPEQLADTIITVGDPERVPHVSRHFDSIEHRVQHREFVIHTGRLGSKRLTVLSTGMGTDNVDIALNELDALANIDFTTRTIKKDINHLTIIRLGTSGAVSAEVALDSIVLSETAIGMDNMMAFYKQKNTPQELALANTFHDHMLEALPTVHPYVASADESLLERFSSLGQAGMTVTAPGFYGPQARSLRTDNMSADLIEMINTFRHDNKRISNMEMETSGIYALGAHLGHRCLSVSAILAHRIHHTFSIDPQKTIDNMIVKALEILGQ
jgi:uridine phosphorylase